MRQPHLCLWLLASAAAAAAAAEAVSAESFTKILGWDCVRDEFVETRSDVEPTPRACAVVCDQRSSCRGFSVATGTCRLFVFDKCSSGVRDCACSGKAEIWTQRLCPEGYGRSPSWCGRKYRAVSSAATWAEQKAACDSDGGLAMLADVRGAQEAEEVKQTTASISGVTDIFVAGQQPSPGVSEPGGGWYWTCGQAVNASLWRVGEPNNSGEKEHVASFVASDARLNDEWDSSPLPAVCECLSPFE